jgi:1-acyl-sn-glycerol-3-phosphate acyltransferase
MGWPTLLVTRARAYGRDRVPAHDGLVYAINHLNWIDVPIVGVLSPRNIDFVAKAEVLNFPGLGAFVGWHGTIAVRRGESDREAVRTMRRIVAEGKALGLFVEGTRQRSGVPGDVQAGAGMVAVQEGVPVVPVAIHGTQTWTLRRPTVVSIAWGEPLVFDGLPKGGKGYKEASAQIQIEIRRLWEWLVDHHAHGRPRGAAPPGRG